MKMKKELTLYLVIAFAGTWLLEVVSLISGNLSLYRFLMTIGMFFPSVGLWAVRGFSVPRLVASLKWHPSGSRQRLMILAAWLISGFLTLAGCALFFMVHPDLFDPDFGGFRQSLGAAGAGADIPKLFGIQLLVSIGIGPLANAVFALGEEAGWRGYLTPLLMKSYGKRNGLLLSGLIWSIWHWPLIIFGGYQYGTGYPFAPWTGLLINTIFMIAFGIILTWLYEASGSILASALAHGGLNAVGAVGLLMMPEIPKNYLAGPVPGGYISVIPMLLLACFVYRRIGSEQK